MGFLKQVFGLFALLVGVGLGAASGCGGSKASAPVPAPVPTCDSTKCLAHNQCVDDGSGVGLQCHLMCNAQTDCPFNYHCTAAPDGSVNFCAADVTALVQGPGLWGAACKVTNGDPKNPDCDWNQGFGCYATSATDGNAFCTRYQCSGDADCKGGWWCATVNKLAGANGARKGTWTVCKPRDYCAPCATDVDCASNGGVPEHCIVDKKGGAYCAPECTTDSNCNNEAHCLTVDQSALCARKGATPGACVCAARAQECVGDGSLCAPCQSDKDCPQGYCLQADYSTEHFCSVKSGVACTADANGKLLTSQCPKTNVAGVPVSCILDDSTNPLSDQCLGVTTFGVDTTTGNPVHVLGCFTAKR